jgi:aminopeptidase N
MPVVQRIHGWRTGVSPRLLAVLLPMLLAVLACSPPDGGPVGDAPEVRNHSFSRPDEVVTTHLELDLRVDFEARQLVGSVALDLENRTGARKLHLDTVALDIQRVELDDGSDAAWALGGEVPPFGRPLVIDILPDTRRVVVHYATTEGARAVQWLEPSQTEGGRHPFLYTQSQSIHARSWVPVQDVPSVRTTLRARVTVPPGLIALMSAENPTSPSDDGVYTFDMPQAIPAYLLALAVGDLEYRAVSDRCGVFAEPPLAEAAAWEFADMERMMLAAEELYGPYRWDRYDVVVLPPSYPFGGMENPRLTFVTPILVAGDRSLVSTIAHEQAHSWSGNLVTNAVWEDFWLNEGFTTYFERRMMEHLYGRETSEMHALLGRDELLKRIEALGADSPETVLRPDPGILDPDQMGGMAYEKGYLFLRLLEETVGREVWDAFLRRYFDARPSPANRQPWRRWGSTHGCTVPVCRTMHRWPTPTASTPWTSRSPPGTAARRRAICTLTAGSRRSGITSSRT